MTKMRWVAVLVVGLLLSACANQLQREAADPGKAAQYNAELGLNYLEQGRYDLAMEKLKRAIEYNPDLAIAHHYIAELYRRLNKPREAEKNYLRAIDLAPDDSSIRNNYGIFLCSQKRYDEGIKSFDKALENPVYSGRAGTYENMGQCEYSRGDKSAAEKYFREGLSINPRLPRALLMMADLSVQEKNYISARAFLQRYSAVAGQTPQSLWLGIQIERVLGDKDALASYALSLKNKFPSSKETELYLKSQNQ